MHRCYNAHANVFSFSFPWLILSLLLQSNLIEVRNIIIDSKSGVSGAGLYFFVTFPSHDSHLYYFSSSNQLLELYLEGRAAKEANLFTEIAEGIHSYGITRHRHGQ